MDTKTIGIVLAIIGKTILTLSEAVQQAQQQQQQP